MGDIAHVVLAGESGGRPVYDVRVVDGGGRVVDHASITGWFSLCAFALMRGWTRIARPVAVS
jgi:hypothetical protein